jgi:folate-dependent phosphoribosylglycinamide formyltransferase PurN
MRVLALCGTQLRHRFVLAAWQQQLDLVGVIFQQRPLVPAKAFQNMWYRREDLELEQRHLQRLSETEQAFFPPTAASASVPTLEVASRDELNHPQLLRWAAERRADVLLDYGSLLLGAAWFDLGIPWMINLHGGLSPWFRGSATLLWPLILGQPECLGATLHALEPPIDGGGIYQHVRPALDPADDPATIGCKTVAAAALASLQLMDLLQSSGSLQARPQKQSGKLFLERDYKPALLWTAYRNLEQGMIRHYLDHRGEYDARLELADPLGLER